MAYRKIEQNNKIHLGINNRVYQFPFVHPWLTFFVLYSVIILLSSINSDLEKLKYSVIISLPVCITIILFVMIYHRNSCYKLVINNATKEVTFHLMFTTKTVVADFDQISVEIGREIKLSVEGKNYRILSETLHDVVSYLPTNTKIIFKGFFGRQFEKELEKTNRPLTPGRLF